MQAAYSLWRMTSVCVIPVAKTCAVTRSAAMSCDELNRYAGVGAREIFPRRKNVTSKSDVLIHPRSSLRTRNGLGLEMRSVSTAKEGNMRTTPHERRVPFGARALLVIVAVGSGLAACHGSGTKRAMSNDAPVEECLAYAELMRSCLGDRTGGRLRASLAVPPKDDDAREKLRSRCEKQSAQARRICR